MFFQSTWHRHDRWYDVDEHEIIEGTMVRIEIGYTERR